MKINKASILTTVALAYAIAAPLYAADIRTALEGSIDLDANTLVPASTTVNVNTESNVDTPTMQADEKAMSTTSVSVDYENTSEPYEEAIKMRDQNVTEVDINDTKVVVKYQIPAKFLGFIPARVTSKTTVEADGTVKMSYPWYTFLASKNDTAIRADIQAQVNALTNNGTMTTLSSKTKEDVVNVVVNTLQAHTQANMSENTSVVNQ